MFRSFSRLLVFSVFFGALNQGLFGQAKMDAAAQEQLNTGNAAFAKGKYKEAERAFKEGNKLGQCQPCLLALAPTYARLGDAKTALATCDRAIAAATDDHERASAHMMKSNLIFAIFQKRKVAGIRSGSAHRFAVGQ